MSDQEIVTTLVNRVFTVTLNRPEKLNAWTAHMEDLFAATLREAAETDEARVIVLTGAGRGFCAGADISLLSTIATLNAGSLRLSADVDFPPDAPPDLKKKYSWLLAVPKPIIAAINGPALGLGFLVSLFCDLRVAASSATFQTAFARRGLVAEYGMGWILPRIVGVANAMDLLITSRTIDAQEALRMGLVQRVLPDDGFGAAVQAMARELANQVSPRSMRVMKQQVYAGLMEGLGAGIDRAFAEMLKSFTSEDFREGVQHFVEKRPPAFPGR